MGAYYFTDSKAQRRILACGIGEAVIDVNLNVSHQDLQSLNLSNNSHYITSSKKEQLTDFIRGREHFIAPGGSVANSIHTLSLLHTKTAFIGNIGKDELGDIFYRDLLKNNVVVSKDIFNDNYETSVCYVFVTPDAERRFAVFRDESKTISIGEYDKELIRSSNYLLLEMYIARNSKACEEMEKAMGIAKQCSSNVVVSLSDPKIVLEHISTVRRFVTNANMIFANELEAMTLSGTKTRQEMINHFLSQNDDKEYVITLGKDGALSIRNGIIASANAFNVNPVDTTGAGDMFLASFLYGLQMGLPREDILRKSCYMSSKVICEQGARLEGDLKSVWNEV